VATGSIESKELLDYLRSPEAAFDVAKGKPVAFRAADQQLLQPLYMVASNPDASWGRLVSERINLGIVVAELSGTDDVVRLDPSGSRKHTGSCNDQ
jgi:hypothetical protein